MAEISRVSGISYPTIHKAAHGTPVSKPVAQAISKATGRVVSVRSLREGNEAAA